MVIITNQNQIDIDRLKKKKKKLEEAVDLLVEIKVIEGNNHNFSSIKRLKKRISLVNKEIENLEKQIEGI